MSSFKDAVTEITPEKKPAPPLPAKVKPAAKLVKKAPNTLTMDVIGVLERTLLTGAPLGIACSAAGISVRTFHRWMAQADDEACRDPLILELAERVRAARATQDTEMFETLKGHAVTNAQVAIRLAEAQNPDVWVVEKKTKATVEATIAPKMPTEDLSMATAEELDELDRLDEARQLILNGIRARKALAA